MIRSFTASVTAENGWFVAQCLEVDIASQGETENEALENLREALELHFAEPQAGRLPSVRSIQVDLGAA
jgi:predicted RNase H-like HicB family nuclease